jgi:hypothetical protein
VPISVGHGPKVVHVAGLYAPVIVFQAPASTAAGQPWYLWPQTSPRMEAESFEPHRVTPDAHIYRVGFQTVGQSWFLWQNTSPRIEPESYTAGRASLYWQWSAPATVTGGQPWYLWPLSGRGAAIEPYESRSAAPDLHRYRTGFQTVGQPYALLGWQSTRQRSETEDYTSRRPDAYWWWATALPQVFGQPYNLLYWQSTRQRSESEEYRVIPPSLYWWWKTPFVPPVQTILPRQINLSLSLGRLGGNTY